jgi:mersacidin/lichenicidin family type 2 lantibiotic
MSPELVIRAWKDPEFRKSLTGEQRDTLPDNPSGRSMTELSEEELLGITGGALAQPAKDLLGPNTGCVGPYKPTCGIRQCSPPLTLEF